ncbi:protein piccolo-like [Palaemon carinicauda]|uniref:protein piccolo-like n=1 Tax=Palaemon carinicauda TaxID=392227 RepID=UPI0035B61FF7
MKFAGRIIPLILLTVLLLYLTTETEARGGGRGGGGRGGGSRGGSRGGGWSWGGGSSSKGSSSRSSSSSYGGVSGSKGSWTSGGRTYQKFGSPSRWSYSGGRRFYYVGYYHGHHYHGHRYGRGGSSDPDGGGGITAAGLIVLLLALIGLGVGLYYAYICLRARPVRPRQHTDCEDGPLIAVDPDVNGNHEDVPVEASAPVDDEPDAKSKLIPDGTDKGKVESNGSIDAMPNGPSKEKNIVLVPIEEKPEPVKLVVEDETVPILNAAPMGFVIPVKEIAEDGTPIHHQPPKKVEFAKQEKAEPEVHHPIHSPVPIFVPVSSIVGKKPVTDSDEEDGLLLQKCSPHDDSLERDSGSVPSSFPSTETEKVPASAPPTDSEPVCSPVKNEGELVSDPVEIVHDKPEIREAIVKPENIAREVLPKGETTLLTKEPEAVLPSKVEPETIPDIPPALMKEEIENLSDGPQPVSEVCNPPEPDSEPPVSEISSTEAAAAAAELKLIEADWREEDDDDITKEPEALSKEPTSDTIVQPEEESIKIEQPETVVESEVCSPENVVRETEESAVLPEITPKEPEMTKVIPDIAIKEPEIPSEKHESVEYPDVVYLKTTVPYEEDEDSEANKDIPLKDQASNPNLKKDESLQNMAAVEVENLEEKNALVGKVSIDNLTDSRSQVMPEVSEEDNAEIPELIVTPVSPIPAEEDHTLTLQLEGKMEPKTDEPLELPVPSKVSPGVPLESEAYYSDSVDEDGALEVIKEEGSIDTELESNYDTETSEPEVTQYTFACGPLVPSTKEILADELSSTLEPQVTKFSFLSDDSNLESEKGDEVSEASPVQGLDEGQDSEEEDSDTETEDQISELDKNIDNMVEDDNVITVGQLPVSQETNRDGEYSGTETEDSESDRESVNIPTIQDQPTTSFKLDESNEIAGEKKLPEIEKVAAKEANEEVLDESSVSKGLEDVDSGPGENETKVPESSKDLNNGKEIPQVTVVNIQDERSTSLSNSSSLSSSSSTSDLSDDEINSPNSKKSKIPRLVERHGS